MQPSLLTRQASGTVEPHGRAPAAASPDSPAAAESIVLTSIPLTHRKQRLEASTVSLSAYNGLAVFSPLAAAAAASVKEPSHRRGDEGAVTR